MTPALEQTLIGLLPVLIGGLLAAIGGALGTMITHWLSVSRELRTSERAKLERIATVAFEIQAWHERRTSAMLFQHVDFHERTPTDELRMLVSLYCPSLRPQLAAVLQASIDCHRKANELRAEQRVDLRAWLARADSMDSYYVLAEVLIHKAGDLVEAVRKMLPK